MHSYINRLSLPYYLLFMLFALHVVVMWPGHMTSDSYGQYQMAITRVFNDHHPPMMSVVWHYLNCISLGPQAILLLHLSLLYAAAFIFLSTFKQRKIKYFYSVFPFLPHIFCYSDMIWKDVGYAFSYLLVGAILTHYTILKKSISIFVGVIVLIILFYGTAVKFQAQYCAPFMLFWVAYTFNHFHFNWKTFSYALGISCLFFILLNTFNNFHVPPKQQSHSWQYVKIYDLAAISYRTQQALFPEFVKTPFFSMDKLNHDFNARAVDNLAFFGKSILKIGKNSEERKKLWHFWFKTIKNHPFLYLQHRINNLNYVLFKVPSSTHLYLMANHFSNYIQIPHAYPILKSTIKLVRIVSMTHIVIFCLSIFYLFLAFKTFKYCRAAIPMLFLNFVSLAMIFAIFIFSMAGTSRYTYISACLTTASHAFAFLCWEAWRQQNKTLNRQ